MKEVGAFFKPGGTLSPDSSSYLVRDADDQIFRALSSGDYVYVLDSRQKGKSSLIAHAIVRLRKAGILTAKIDLQRLGANLTTDQWYAGLLHSIGQDLNMLDELFEYWKANQEVGPLSRWLGAISEVALKNTTGNLIIFIDEVDFVQALKFSSDEFFAGIRSCYNSRSENSRYDRLSFCLVGVATPRQLINNDQVTPFNIGHQIALQDFSRSEVQPFAAILSEDGRNGESLLDRIYFWVSGHPYLTQLLASKVAERPSIKSPKDVDNLVKESLLNSEARHSEPNLSDVERRLLQPSLPNATGDEARSQILDLYRSILEKKVIRQNYEDPLVASVLLSGVAKTADGRIVVRNRAYRALFDRKWYKSNLPDAEARRLSSAAARAAWRVAWVSIGVFSIIVALLGWAFYLASDRDRALTQSRQLNNANLKMAYEASMVLASKEARGGNWLQVGSLVESQKDSPFKGWEWTYWNTVLCEPKFLGVSSEKNIDGGPQRVWEEEGKACTIAEDSYVCGDKKIGRAGSTVSREWVFKHRNEQPLAIRVERANRVPPIEGLVDLSQNLENCLVLVNQQALEFKTIDGVSKWKMVFPQAVINSSIVRGDRMVVATLISGQIIGIDARTGRQMWSKMIGRNHGLISSPDGEKILVAKDDRFGVVLDSSSGEKVSDISGHSANITSGNWFKDSSRLVTTSADGTVCLWRVSNGFLLRRYVGFRDNVTSAVPSPDEKSVICVLGSGVAMTVEIAERHIFDDLEGHKDQVQSVQFSPSGRKMITASIDGRVILWDRPTRKMEWTYELGALNEVVVPKFSRDGTQVALVTPSHARILDAKTGHCVHDVLTNAPTFNGSDFLVGGEVAVPLDSQGVGVVKTDGTLKIIPIIGMTVTKIVVSHNRQQIYAVGDDAQLAIIDSQKNAVIERLKMNAGKPKSIACSPNGRWLAIGNYDSKVYLVDLNSNYITTKLVGHTSRLFSARFSPDSQKIVTNSADTTSRLFEVNSGKQIAIMRHGSWVSSANWSPDGTRIVTASDDGKVRIFDGHSGALLSEIESRSRTVFDAKFSPDGKDMVSIGFDGVIRYWHPSSQ